MFRPLITLSAMTALSAAALAQPQPRGAATSLEVNRHGIGHMLIVPYFSTQGGNATLLNVVNATDTGKAVKIRFRGAGNGDELFSLQVFLARRDMWTLNVAAGADGLPVLTTFDRSCTLPAAISGRKFSTARLNPALTGDALANQAREGYIEIIAMGDVVGTVLGQAISHTATIGGPSCTPSVLDALGRFDSQLAPPSTGLMASWVLINVPQTTTWAGEAVAYEARLDGTASTGNNVFFPQTTAPLTAADVASYTADPLYNFANNGPIVAPTSQNLPDLSTPYTSTVTSPQHQATELSFEIAARVTAIEYLTDPAIQASTDWVLSMPTRRYHAAVDYRGPTLITNRGSFGHAQAVYFTGLTGVSAAGQSCYETVAPSLFVAAFDREGKQPLILSPDLRGLSFCGVVPVLSVRDSASGAPSLTLKAAATRTALHPADFYIDGSAIFGGAVWEGAKGLPMLVQQFSRAVNPQVAPGVSGTFGATWAGRTLIPGASP